MTTKNILKSKTFWVNLFGIAATLSGYLPPEWAALALAVSNIGLRFVTNSGVTIFKE